MLLEDHDGKWLNTRFILNIYADGDMIKIKMIDGDVHDLLYIERCTQDDVTAIIRIISAEKLTKQVVSSKELFASYQRFC